MNLSIRTLTEADLDSADGILQSAFGSPFSRKAELRWYLALQPDGWLLATLEGKPVGMVGALNYGNFAYIGLMGILGEAQKRGIGRALMQKLFSWLDVQRCPMALLDATEAGTPLYSLCGFVANDTTRLFEQTSRPIFSYPTERVNQLRAKELKALIDFDAPIFGAKREQVLSMFLAEYPDRAFVVYDETGQISGYLFAQSRRLGPWVAFQPQDAAALLGVALTLQYNGAPYALAPAKNIAGVELLIRSGFHPQRSCLHMRRGGSGLPSQRDKIYGQASFAIG